MMLAVNVTKLFSSSLKLSGLYYKHITIVNDNSSVINKLEASLTDDARVISCDHNMYILQAKGQICLIVHICQIFASWVRAYAKGKHLID